MKNINKNYMGILFNILAIFIFSLQDIGIKWIGGDYPSLQIATFLSVAALPFILFFYRKEGGKGLPVSSNPKLQFLRGSLHFLSFVAYVMGIASQPLGDIAALRNAIPLVITLLSVVFLGEQVGLRRWLALVVGFVGVFFIVKGGSATFNIGAIFTLLAVLFYSLSAIVTRKLTEDSSATMAYYSAVVYIVGSLILTPIVLAIGPVPNAHPSIAFLLRPWAVPGITHLAILLGLGLVWASGMYCSARAYSMAEASVIAPFENVVLPINVMWGFLLWGDVPSWLMLFGASLTLMSGIYCSFEERREQFVKYLAQTG